MTIILKLVWRDLIKNPALVLFTFLAIAAATCLATWFVASIDMNAMNEHDGSKDFYGKYSLALCTNRYLNPDICEMVHDIPGVASVAFALQVPADMKLLDFKEGDIPTGYGENKSPALMGMNELQAPFPLASGRWFQNPGECVVSSSAERILTRPAGQVLTLSKDTQRTIQVGDKIQVETFFGPRILTVVGTIKQDLPRAITKNPEAKTFSFGFGLGFGGGKIPQAKNASPNKTKPQAAPAKPAKSTKRKMYILDRGPLVPSPTNPSVYLSMSDAVKLTPIPSDVNIMFVQLDDPTKVDLFYKNLEEACHVTLQEQGIRTEDFKRRPRDTKKMLRKGQTSAAVIGQAWSTVGIVILASVFIIFTTLSLGVTDKTRQLAMLRTIGFTSAQVASIIILEGLVLGLLGWLGGIISGWLIITVLLFIETGILPLVTLSYSALLFALMCSILGALAASLLPAWKAARISPTDALTNRFQRFSKKQILWALLVGAVILLVIPLIVFCPSLDVRLRLLLFASMGTLLLGLAFLAIIPALSVFTERLIGYPVASLMKLNPTFLKQLLTGNQWRTIGTTVSLSIGLGLFTAVYIWSFSMLSLFTVTDETPNFLVRFHENAISPETTQALLDLPALKQGQPIMRPAVAQPDFNQELSERLLNRGTMAANVVCMGIDPDLAWNEQSPMLKFPFTDGSPEEARKAFSDPQARVCVITRTLSLLANLKMGDSFQLKLPHNHRRPQPSFRLPPPPEPPAHFVDYTVVGIVDYPWMWFSKCANVRVSTVRTSSLIFAPYQRVIEDFAGLKDEFFWFDADIPHHELLAQVQDIAARGFKDFEEKNPGKQPVYAWSGGTPWDPGLNKRHVVLSSRESLNNSLLPRSYGFIDTMAQMPIIILLLASIAVVNTILVSVKSRTWSFGILRACGLTQGALARLIIAEALLIGFCACILSFGFGLYYAWLTSQMADLAPVFGVSAPSLVIPWSKLLPGYLLTMALTVAASLYPALTIGRKPLDDLLRRRDA